MKRADLARLSAKQFAFLTRVLEGESLVGAYVASYSWQGSRRHAANEGWKLSRRPVIAQIIEAEREARLISARERGQRLRERIEERLATLLDHADPRIVLKAVKLVGELGHVRAFDTSRELEEISVADVSEVLAQIEQLCSAHHESGAALDDGCSTRAIELGETIDPGE